MPEEYGDRFQSEVMASLQKLVAKSIEHDKEFGILKEMISVADGRSIDVASKVLEIDKRLTAIEAKLSLVEMKLTGIDDEVKQVRIEMDELNQRFDSGIETRNRIGELEVRVFELEEKLAA